MFSHVMIGSNDPAKAKTFYDALIAVTGGKPGFQDDNGRVSYRHKGSVFMISKPINGEPACHANGGTIGFAMDDPEQVHAWHEAGLSAGGTACEDPPGVRENAFGKLYLAYLRDPDGNKVCALHRVTT